VNRLQCWVCYIQSKLAIPTLQHENRQHVAAGQVCSETRLLLPLQLYRYILTKSPLQLHLFSNLLFVHMTSNFGNLLFSKSFDDFGGGREGGEDPSVGF